MRRQELMKHPEYRAIVSQYRIVAGLAGLAIIGGAFFYHHVEKLSWLNAIYFCVITLGTVGYGDIVPKTDPGKIFTIFYVLAGIGIIARLGSLTIRRAILAREYK